MKKQKKNKQQAFFVLVFVLFLFGAGLFFSYNDTRFVRTGSVSTDICNQDVYGTPFTSQDCQLYADGIVPTARTSMYHVGYYQSSNYYSPSPSQATLYFYGPQWLTQ
jgi:hypothetical protein